jgi:hypothetical protein
MAHPAYITKSFRMKPEVNKIFDDLEEWLDVCRFHLIRYDEKDLYRSPDYKEFKRRSRYENNRRGNNNNNRTQANQE